MYVSAHGPRDDTVHLMGEKVHATYYVNTGHSVIKISNMFHYC